MPGSSTVNPGLKKTTNSEFLSDVGSPIMGTFLSEGSVPSWRIHSGSGFAYLHSNILFFLSLLTPLSLLCQVSSNKSTSTN